MPLSARSITSVLSSKKAKIGVAAVLGTAVVVGGGTFAYSAAASDVNLSVDGNEREVASHADTVGDLLSEQGIEVGDHDHVTPSPDTSLEDGSAITVQYGRELSLAVDGTEKSYWVTSRSVDRALDEIGRTFPAKSEFSTSRSAPISREGIDVEVVTPKSVTVELAGKKPQTKKVAALNVGDLLNEFEVDVEQRDQINHKPGAQLRDGMKVVFTDFSAKKKSVKDETVGFETVEREDASMYEDEEETVREGQEGARNVTYNLVFRNGDLVKRKVLDSKVTEKPVAEIVKVGTKERPEPDLGSAPAGVWGQLAECESGGNPQAVNPAGPYYGLYQFTASTWASVGGSGVPTDHDAAEQTKRAQILQSQAGWGQWPACAAELGLL